MAKLALVLAGLVGGLSIGAGVVALAIDPVLGRTAMTNVRNWPF